jgi:Tol biopolymer transport system component
VRKENVVGRWHPTFGAAVLIGLAASLAGAADGREGAALEGRLAVGVTREKVTELYVLPATGGRARMISRRGDGVTAHEPAWAPDGRQIAFASDSVAGEKIGLVDPDGSRLRLLTTTRERKGTVSAFSPSWSRDGQFVLFSQVRLDPPWTLTLRRVRPDGTGARTLWSRSHANRGEVLRLSPDEKHILYSHITGDNREDLYRVDVDGKRRQRLTRNGDGSQIKHALWSPDAKQIAFCLYLGYPASSSRDFPSVWVVNTDGSGQKRLTPWDASCGFPRGGIAWSPASDWIAFGRHRAGLFAIRPDGTGLRAIDRELPATSVSWTR